jgi:outer membrane protein assembly factor BamB
MYLTTSLGLHAIDLATGTERWRVATPSMANSQPVFVDGVVYFISEWDPPTNWSAVVHAVNASNGQELWTFEPEGILQADRWGLMGPLIVSDHKVYVFESFQVYVLDAQVGLLNGEPVDSAFLPIGDEIVAAHDDQVLLANMSHSEVGCVDLATGAELWTAPVSTNSFGVSSSSDETTLYLVDPDNALVALDWATGEQRWSHPADTMDTIEFVRVADGELLVSRDDIIEGIDPVDGSTRWQINVPNGDADDASLQDGTLFIATDEYAIDAVDVKSGQQRWSLQIESRVSALAFDDNDALIIVLRTDRTTDAATAPNIMLVDPATGAPIWSIELP